MVAPRTRAERPAENPPAARPARKASRRAAPDGAVDRSPPEAPASITNGQTANGNGSAPTAAAHPARRRHDLSSPEVLGEALIASILKHDDDANVDTVRQAIDFAIEAHGDQKRASGEPYVTHPIAVGPDPGRARHRPDRRSRPRSSTTSPRTPSTRCPTSRSASAPRSRSSSTASPSSASSAPCSHEQQQAENIRKMFLAMADDIRVVLIKLADRLHNMRTLAALPPEKQQRIARQTLEIYAPLAERLGIWQIKWELEDLAFKIARARALPRAGEAARHAAQGPRALHRAGDRRARAAPRRPPASRPSCPGRPKHIYSIWKKMQRKGAEFGEIYDVYAIRILVDDVRDCYAALGIVHALWRPIPGQFDDYIAVPKNNLYQSLHTAVIAIDGKPLEIQIRTHAMHQVSRGRHRGPLALQGRLARPTASTTPSWPGCASSWTGSATSVDATEFVEGVKLDIFQDQVFVFTPKGDIKDLPAGATPLDFAYRIHTDVGHRTIGAKVNNRLVPLDYRLKNGDIVEIVTTKGGPRPVARLAEHRPDPARPGEDPAMVQAPGA